ncbi:MAG: hypothetical protein ACI4RD_01905 [Kiritimatiellia bacterium]
MKQSIRVGIVAFALAAVSSACAADAETESEYEAIGWTPVEIGLASPVQLPWGCHQWDIFGLGLNAIWNDAPKMYGLGVGGVAMATRGDMCGLQVGGLCNWATEDVYGLRLTIGGNITFGTTYGMDAGLFAYRSGDMWGMDVEFIGSYQRRFWGWQVGGLATVCTEQSYGCAIALLCNWAPVAYGCDLSIFNYTTELHGCQIGLVNYARECPWGFQIGLVNIIMDNSWKVLPIVNGYF